MDSASSDKNQKSVTIDQSGQTVEGPQVRTGGGARIDHVGDKIGGDKIGRDKISGDVVITGQVDGDVQITYVQRAPVPPPPPPLRPPQSELFVGREAELSIYAAALEQAGIAVISGMAGMGKTTLAAELARRVSRPEKIFWHSFHEGEGVEGVVWRLAAFLAANGEEAIWEMLQNAQSTNSRPPPPELLFDYLVEQVRRRSYLLCLDDFQYVHDNPLLNQLVERIRPLLPAGELKLIITSREIPDFVQLVSFEPLAGLTPSDLSQMLAAAGVFLEEEQIAQLHTYTGGNAQMLTLALDLLGSGYEAQELLEQLLETDDIEDFLMDEVESRLTRNERLVMSAVAVLQGYPGSRAAIEAVLDGRRQRRVIRDLSDRFLLTVTRIEGDRFYNQHAIVRDFFYENLNQRERQRMHLRAADYYHDEEPDILLAIRHYLLGGNHSQAAVLVEDNVYLLLNQGQGSALDHLLGQIERGQLSARDWIAVQLVSGQVSSFLGLSEEANENYQDALNELGSLPESKETAELYARISLGMAEVLEFSNPQEALSWAENGVTSASELDALQKAELLIVRGRIEMQLGEFPAARQSLNVSLDLLPEEQIIMRGRALKNLVPVSFYTGEIEAAREYAQQALSISRQMQDPFMESSVLINYAIMQYVSGSWLDAIASFKQALAISHSLGNRSKTVNLELNLGKALIYTGDYGQSGELLEQALHLAAEIGDELLSVRIHINLAELRVLQQLWDEAEASLAAAEKMILDLQANGELPSLYSVWTETNLGKHETDAALQRAEQALAAAEQIGDPYETGIAMRVNGLAQQAAGDLLQAQDYLRQSLDLLQDIDPFQIARGQFALGSLLAATDGRHEEGQDLLSEARDTFKSLGAIPDLEKVEEALSAHQLT